MKTKIIIEFLNENSVTIVKRNVITDQGKDYYVGNPHRTSYLNSENGREVLRNEVIEPYYSSIMEIWGDTPTVVDNIEEIQE